MISVDNISTMTGWLDGSAAMVFIRDWEVPGLTPEWSTTK